MKLTIQIPTEPSYYGSETNAEEVPMIADRLEEIILNRFGSQHEIVFERTQTPKWSGVRCPEHPMTADDVGEWIAANWTQAL